MSTYPFKRKINLKVIGIILASVVLLAGAGTGAYLLLRQLKPHEQIEANTDSNAATRSGDSTRLKAEDLMKRNDLPGAKAEYEKAAAAYSADQNSAAAADARQQIDIINQTINKAGTSSQTPTPKGSGSASSAE